MASLRDQLQSIYDQRGELTPAAVVDEARPEDHPLHDRFEWDDTAAGEAYRRVQARELIRSVRIKYAETSRGPKEVRAFHAVRVEPETREMVFKATEELLTDDTSREMLLNDMRREWKAFQRRWQHMEEFAELLRQHLAETATA